MHLGVVQVSQVRRPINLKESDVRYRVSVVELIPVPSDGTDVESAQPEVEGQPIFQTVVEFKPNLSKLIATLTPPRIRKSRAKSA